MKEFEYDMKEYLGKGLVPIVKTVVNFPGLVTCEGTYPEEGALHSRIDLPLLDLSSLSCAFPYPQVLVLSSATIVCTPTAILEYVGGVLNTEISSLTAGTPWSYADFGPYILFSNSRQTVARTTGGVYSVLPTTSIPASLTLCGVRGQVVLGAPNMTQDAYWNFNPNSEHMSWLHRIINVELPNPLIW